MTAASTPRPKVLIAVLLNLIISIMTLGTGLVLMQEGSEAVPPSILYLNLVLGAVGILSAILMALYKRAGLYLGLMVYGVSMVLALIDLLGGGRLNLFFVLRVTILYLLIRYVTIPSDKAAFT